MGKTKFSFLPIAKNHLEVLSKEAEEINKNNEKAITVGDTPCPCCGYRTIPNYGDALAYICPVCLWEIDLFIQSANEPSDQNHGLTLNEARKNYIKFGAVLASLKIHCRLPKEHERPIK